MKRPIFVFLTLMMIALFLSSAISEGCGDFQQAADPDAVTMTWEGADGAKYVLFVYTETTVIDCNGNQQTTEEALTAEELNSILDWLNAQLQTEAADTGLDSEFLDPAVSATAQPAEVEFLDPAVLATAQPPAVEFLDPAVLATAQPAATPPVDNTVYCTAQPAATCKNTAQPAAAPSPTPQPAARPASQPIVSTGDYTTFDSTMQEQKLLNLLNEDRARNGLPPLTLDPELSQLAKLKSNDMNSNRYFAHESPTYGDAGQMLDAFDYDYQGVGENIAHHANVEKAEAAFMSSDGHRRNILGSQWLKVGIGVAYDENGNVYVTQLFAR